MKFNIIKLAITAIVGLTYNITVGQDIQEVWDNMNSYSSRELREKIESITEANPENTDAIITQIYLNSLEGSGHDNIDAFTSMYPNLSDPNPYIYSLWFNSAVIGGYGKYNSKRIMHLKKLLLDDKINHSIKSSLNYMLGMSSEYSNNKSGAKVYWNKITVLKNWQFVGTFDNAMGSGYDKSYAPIEHPKNDYEFLSLKNAKVEWFVPNKVMVDPWVTTKNHLDENSGISYFQTFVQSDSDAEHILAMGAGGSIKVWVNDELVIAEDDELVTDYDYYKAKIKLNKGYNRVLVQLGYTDETSFPNFAIRFLGDDGHPIKLSSTSDYHDYNAKSGDISSDMEPHYAIEYFRALLENDKNNLVNYLLLADAYMRSQENNDAIRVTEQGLEVFPDNMLLLQKKIRILLKDIDRTKLLTTVEKLRNIKPDLLFFDMYDFKTNLSNEDYDKAQENLDNIEDYLGANSSQVIEYKIDLAAARNEHNKIIELIEYGYDQHPDKSKFVGYKYSLDKNTGVPTKKALKTIVKYLESNHSNKLTSELKEAYKEINQFKKLESILIKKHTENYETIDYAIDLAAYYFDKKEYHKALKYLNHAIGVSPYNSNLYYFRAYIYLSLPGNLDNAISDIKSSIYYEPNSFEARELLRQVQEKPSIQSLVTSDTREDELREQQKTYENKGQYNFSYLLEEINHVIYPEGSSVQFHEIGILIHNEAGIEHWKETYLGVNSYRQRLVVTKADVLKKSGEKLQADRNYNEIVFPSLEVGDIIHVSYRLENYTGGKLAKEFWDQHIFNGFVPVVNSTYRVYSPITTKLNIKLNDRSENIEYKEYEVDDFVCREWVGNDLNIYTAEDNMPQLSDVAATLHISTLSDWSAISDWYKDLALPLAEDDYATDKVYNEIMAGNEDKSDYEKAQLIYQYICDNVQYSSVSFRQSGLVPQKPKKTISARLGDCKDVSLLYHSLAKKAGLKTNLVLVSTRQNGENDMILPSINFNHCIIRIDLDDKEPMYQELTNKYLPFGTLENLVMNAQGLVIPNSKSDNSGTGSLINIPANRFVKDKYNRSVKVEISDNDYTLQTDLNVYGSPAADYRNYFDGIAKSDLENAVSELYSDISESEQSINYFEIGEILSTDSSFVLSTEISVKDDIKSIGGIKAFKPPLFETIGKISDFQLVDRKSDYLLWNYNPIDEFVLEMDITIPEGKKIMELPKDVSIKSDYVDYSLTFELIDDRNLKLIRKAYPKRITVPAEEYADLKAVFKKISTAEDVYIAFQ